MFLNTDVPGQVPGRPYASDTSLRSVILSWGCPSSDGGSPVTGYRVEMCEAETEVWQTLTEQCHVSIHPGWLGGGGRPSLNSAM